MLLKITSHHFLESELHLFQTNTRKAFKVLFHSNSKNGYFHNGSLSHINHFMVLSETFLFAQENVTNGTLVGRFASFSTFESPARVFTELTHSAFLIHHKVVI